MTDHIYGAPYDELSLIDQRRIQFLIGRDGLQVAMEWALRTARLYRKALLSARHYAKNREYRRRFILSYLELKRFGLGG